jgi:hypothetical protein
MINTILYESFGKFTLDWKEFIKDSEMYWYNKELQKSTWDSPIFILLNLIDNRVNTNLVPLFWENINENYLKIFFKNSESLYLDKITRVSN